MMKGKLSSYGSKQAQPAVMMMQVALMPCVILLGWWVQWGACCSTTLSFNGTVHAFEKCVDLPAQAASLAWTLAPPSSSSSLNTDYYVLQVAFSGTAPSSNGWMGWGLNPEKAQMAGSSAFLAYNAPNGSTLLPYKLTMATLGGAPLVCSAIDYTVRGSAVQISGSSMAMFITLLLNASAPAPTLLNHVWNRGPSVANFRPAPHSMLARDLQSLTRLDMSAQLPAPSSSSTAAPPKQLLKTRHGLINIVAWGLVIPMGALVARYMKPFADPIWFYVHVLFQCAGYALGASGWALGLQLEKESIGVAFHKHKTIGMVLFSLSTLQVMALLVRPKKEHSLRRHWNIYHHSVGYGVIVLGITNVFEGVAISDTLGWPYHAFICSVVALGAVAVVLESINWFLFYKSCRKECSSNEGPFISSHSQQQRKQTMPFGPTEHILRVL